MICHRHDTRQGGVTLIEVLIALLIFSFGLVGIAGLLVMATSANHGAYLRTQVEYLAQNMADRMSANPIGVWNADYDDANYPLSVTQSCAGSCNGAQLATHDQEMWSAQLRAFLPNPRASIDCSNLNTGYNPVDSGELNLRPPFGGTCQMTITWSDRGSGSADDRQTADQTFAWEFQP